MINTGLRLWLAASALVLCACEHDPMYATEGRYVLKSIDGKPLPAAVIDNRVFMVAAELRFFPNGRFIATGVAQYRQEDGSFRLSVGSSEATYTREGDAIVLNYNDCGTFGGCPYGTITPAFVQVVSANKVWVYERLRFPGSLNPNQSVATR
jgi:hypothetical protein